MVAVLYAPTFMTASLDASLERVGRRPLDANRAASTGSMPAKGAHCSNSWYMIMLKLYTSTSELYGSWLKTSGACRTSWHA